MDGQRFSSLSRMVRAMQKARSSKGEACTAGHKEEKASSQVNVTTASAGCDVAFLTSADIPAAAETLLRQSSSVSLEGMGAEKKKHGMEIALRKDTIIDISQCTLRTAVPAVKKLPDEVLDDIFLYMRSNVVDVAACSIVCRNWHRIASAHLWQSLNVTSHSAFKRLGKTLRKAMRRRKSKEGRKLSTATTNLPVVRSIQISALAILPENLSLKFYSPFSVAKGIRRYIHSRDWMRVICLVQAFPNLQRLDLSYSGGWLRDDVLRTIVKTCGSTLEDLSLAHGYLLTDEAMTALAKNCRALQKLDISHCLLVGDTGVSEVAEARNTSMTELLMAGCNVADVAILYLGVFCTELRVLDLEDCYMLTPKSLTVVIARCLQLEHVNFPCFVYPRLGSDNTPHPVMTGLLKRPESRQLKSLGLSMCSGNAMDIGLPQILARFPAIRTLKVSGSPTISSLIAPAMSRITRLILASTGQVDDDFAEAIAMHCYELRYLDLSHCRVKSIGAAHILVRCRKLVWLSLAYNRDIWPVAIWTNMKDLTREMIEPHRQECHYCAECGSCWASKNCLESQLMASSLHTLDLSHIVAIHDRSLEFIAPIAPNIAELNISYSPKLTSIRDILYLVDDAPQLYRLNVSCCDGLFVPDEDWETYRTVDGMTEMVKITKEGLRSWSDDPPNKTAYHHPLTKLDRQRYCVIDSKMPMLRAIISQNYHPKPRQVYGVPRSILVMHQLLPF